MGYGDGWSNEQIGACVRECLIAYQSCCMHACVDVNGCLSLFANTNPATCNHQNGVINAITFRSSFGQSVISFNFANNLKIPCMQIKSETDVIG